MHIASSLNKNQLALYGPTDIKRTRPIGKNTLILKSQNKYLHAMHNFIYSEQELSNRFPNYELMSQITVKDVIDTINNSNFLE